MPFHTVDPLKKNNKYKAIGNRSKNELYPTKQIKPKDRKKKNKNKLNKDLDFIVKGIIDKANFTNPIETVTPTIIQQYKKPEKELTIPEKVEIIEKIVENELIYLLPTILAI